MKKVFITFEGGEAVGKTTIIKELEKFLKSKHFSVFKTKEPGDPKLPFSTKIKELIMNTENILPLTELLLFTADRHEHVQNVIKKNLNKVDYLICDRYIDSTFVYQGKLEGIDISLVKKINAEVSKGYIPKYTFILDVDYETAKSRIDKRKGNNKFDYFSKKKFEKIRNEFIKLSKTSKRFHLINTNKPISEILKEILKIIK